MESKLETAVQHLDFITKYMDKTKDLAVQTLLSHIVVCINALIDAIRESKAETDKKIDEVADMVRHYMM
jgi:hypothetical protein